MDEFWGGQGIDPNTIGRSMLMQQILRSGGLGQPAQSPSQGASQIGSSLIAAMLMNPDLAKKLKNGFGNWFNGAPDPSTQEYM